MNRKNTPHFTSDRIEALRLAKEVGAFVIYSIAPTEKDVRTAKTWGYWVEKHPPMIRAWEKIIYEPCR